MLSYLMFFDQVIPVRESKMSSLQVFLLAPCCRADCLGGHCIPEYDVPHSAECSPSPICTLYTLYALAGMSKLYKNAMSILMFSVKEENIIEGSL